MLSFGPGIHTLDERRFRGEDRSGIPKDVTIIGAGRDSTLLQMGDISSRTTVDRLTFRNITLDAQNDGLFDLRLGSLSLHLESVRIVRFDAGHGGCSIFSVRGGSVLRARDSQIVGGYGRAPGRGGLFRGTPFLARFTNCHLELVELRLERLGRDSKAVFQNCSFVRPEGDADPVLVQNPSVAFYGCRSRMLETRNRHGLQRDLSELFYGFGR